mgnify:CR=1 FL=1
MLNISFQKRQGPPGLSKSCCSAQIRIYITNLNTDHLHRNTGKEDWLHMYTCCNFRSAILSNPYIHHKFRNAKYDYLEQRHPNKKSTNTLHHILNTYMQLLISPMEPSHIHKGDRAIF